MMSSTQHDSRKLLRRVTLIATGMATGGLSAALFVFLAAATGI